MSSKAPEERTWKKSLRSIIKYVFCESGNSLSFRFLSFRPAEDRSDKSGGDLIAGRPACLKSAGVFFLFTGKAHIFSFYTVLLNFYAALEENFCFYDLIEGADRS